MESRAMSGVGTDNNTLHTSLDRKWKIMEGDRNNAPKNDVLTAALKNPIQKEINISEGANVNLKQPRGTI